jgi:hypothetical protein
MLYTIYILISMILYNVKYDFVYYEVHFTIFFKIITYYFFTIDVTSILQ